MNWHAKQTARWGAGILAIALAAGAGGYWLGHSSSPGTVTGAGSERKILYWYDPMVPAEHYDNPNSLSSMGMKTIPKYADEGAATATAPGVSIDPAVRQSLGLRVVTAEIGTLPSSVTVTGTIDFNQRNVAIIQARSGGFITRVYGRAPGDVIGAGEPIADLHCPNGAARRASISRSAALAAPTLPRRHASG
jgi:Cu(I)/Ag(I) efflux system membrane fusion protein